MIQNHIILYLRKTLIAFPFLLGSLMFLPQVALSAAIETAGFKIDPFPLHPVESGALYINVTKKGACNTSDVVVPSIAIDPVNRQIEVAIDTVTPFSGGNDPCHAQFLITDNLPNSGEYKLFVTDLSFGGTPHRPGPAIFTVSPASSASIPTLSEWMLILMAFLLSFFAIREMQKNNVFISNK